MDNRYLSQPPGAKKRQVRRRAGDKARMSGDAFMLLGILREDGGVAVFPAYHEIGYATSRERDKPVSTFFLAVRELVHLDLVHSETWSGNTRYFAKEGWGDEWMENTPTPLGGNREGGT